MQLHRRPARPAASRPSVLLLALPLLLAACDIGGNRGPTEPPPPRIVTVQGSLSGTFTGRAFRKYLVKWTGTATGQVQSTDATFRARVPAGRYTFRFEGAELLLPRERSGVQVDGDTTLTLDAIEADYGFNVQHFTAIAAQPTGRFNVSNLTVFALETDRQGDVPGNVSLFADLSRDRVSAGYGGIVQDTSNAGPGDIFVRTTHDIPGGLGSTVQYHSSGNVIDWVEVFVRPNAAAAQLRHEYARTLGFPGNGPPSSIFWPGIPNGVPSEDDRDAVWFNYGRRAGATLDDADRD